MQKDYFTLHFSMPLDAQDWDNLSLSSVKRVMLPLAIARQEDLARLKGMNIKVLLRVGEQDYYRNDAPGKVRQQVQSFMGICQVEGVIIGCEPEGVVANLGYGAPDWGQQLAFEHARRMDAVRQALCGLPQQIALIAPGWTARTITEDSLPAPGTLTWRDICRDAYWKCDGIGAHVYEYGWTQVDVLRLKFTLQKLEELFHLNLYIDEVGVPGDDLTQMNAYIDIANLLMKSRLGDRVRMLCPFVSNGDPGNPPAWDPRFLIKDPQAYRVLGAWLRS